jgi:flagellum-specific ATP synthase
MGSVSRCMTDVVSREQMKAAHKFLETLATYRRSEDLINIGAYAAGTNPKIDKSISMIDRLTNYLRQDVEQRATFEDSRQQLLALAR